jgi:anthranilate/para-aminobenzoate synthase component I
LNHYSLLLDVAERLEPPLVLLEDGRGTGPALLAWGELRGVRLGPDGGACTLESFRPGDRLIGAIAYDAGLPAGAPPRAAPLAVPAVELFEPRHRILLRPGASPLFSDDGAREAWARGGNRQRRSPDAATSRSLGRSFTREGFEAAVRTSLEYIRAGDIYQANISVAEHIRLGQPPFEVYRRLRVLNPSPWMGYADFGGWQLVCGSPELLVEVAHNRARARPIAGTRRKTGDPAADAAMRSELTSDSKESAEHVMLVDLARNDLGRVARYGSVEVGALAAVEEYSHVMHLVSDVTAELRPGVTPLDVFRAMFPGGTITGCPKIRAMEIIAELEPVARGMYTGALGWWEGGSGQWNILIRSALVRGGEMVIQSGAGIVADSDPAREWKESLRKAAALRAAVGLVD